MAKISNVIARQVLDSRGVPTVEVTVELDNGTSATSSVPSGNVSNKSEAVELRDQRANEYFGLGVTKAVENVNTLIRDRLVGMDALYQTQVDQMLVNLDGTTNKSRLGSNAILATSQAVMKAAAASLKLPLFVYVKEKYQLISTYRIPTPIFNLLNGGRHGSGTLEFQEFQLVPASHLPYGKALQIGVETFMALDKILEQKGAIRAVGMEGGYSPNLAENTDALEIFAEAMKLTPYALAKDAFLGIDVAPKAFFKSGKYTIKDRNQPMTSKEMIKFYQDLHHQYRVFSFEDPLVPDAWDDWKFMTAEMGATAMVVADDLVTTNKTLLMKAIQEKACNTLVIKPNRVGTVTETIEITQIARQAGWHTILSHRSGETTDDFIADLAVGIGTEYVKFGAPSRGERVVKYNRLLRIEEILSSSSPQKQQTQSSGGTMNPTTPATTPPATAPAVSTQTASAVPASPMGQSASLPAPTSAPVSPPAPMAARPATTTPAPTTTPSVPPMMAAFQNTATTMASSPAPANPFAQAGSGLQSLMGTQSPATASPAAPSQEAAPASGAPTESAPKPEVSESETQAPANTSPLAAASTSASSAPTNPAWNFPAPTSDELVATPVPGLNAPKDRGSSVPATSAPTPTATTTPATEVPPAVSPSMPPSVSPSTPAAAPTSAPLSIGISGATPQEATMPASDEELQKSIDQLAGMVNSAPATPTSPAPASSPAPVTPTNPTASTASTTLSTPVAGTSDPAATANSVTPSFPAGLKPPTPPQI